MNDDQTLLKVLLRSRHLQEHRAFERAYAHAAGRLDPHHPAHPPSKATFYRWLSGDVAGLPRPDHCRVLEAMFPGVQARRLLAPWDGDDETPAPDGCSEVFQKPAASEVAITYASRAEFLAHVSLERLLGSARRLRICGLSLTMICQHYGDRGLRPLLQRGGEVQALFLSPTGPAARAREQEEGLPAGSLSGLTRFNMEMLRRVHQDLPDCRPRLQVRTYDSVARVNLTLVDDLRCIAQPYLPVLRGFDTPTTAIERTPGAAGQFEAYERVYAALWASGTRAW